MDERQAHDRVCDPFLELPFFLEDMRARADEREKCSPRQPVRLERVVANQARRDVSRRRTVGAYNTRT
jgi:hypothetical protein